MEEAVFKRKQIVIAAFEIILKSLGFIIGILIGVYQFNKQQSVNKIVEYRKEVWQKELDHYQKICTTTGKILTSITPGQVDVLLYKEGAKEFLIQYWGEALFYSNDSIKTKLMDFREKICTLNIDKYKGGDKIDFEELEDIRKAGTDLVNSYENCYTETQKKMTNE